MTVGDASRLLLIDLGNSRTKWALVVGADWEAAGTAERAGQAVRDLPGQAPDAIAVAVTGADADLVGLEEAVAETWTGVQLRRATTGASFGALRNAYEKPASMGVDRWLGMMAAWEPGAGPCCIIDAGTAVTVDVVAGDGQHSGGWIAPGLRLMQEALATRTHRVGDHVGQETHQTWGTDTGDAVAAGCAAAFRGVISAALDAARATHPEVRFVVSGGSAEAAGAVLASRGAAWDHRPQLVLEGLARWLHGAPET